MNKPVLWKVSVVLSLLALLAAGCQSTGQSTPSSATRVEFAGRRLPPNATCPSCAAALWIGKVKEFEYIAEGMGGKPVPCPNCGEEFDPELQKSIFYLNHPY